MLAGERLYVSSDHVMLVVTMFVGLCRLYFAILKRSRAYKKIFMFNSAKYKILNAHKTEMLFN